jgi:hypothetical protein
MINALYQELARKVSARLNCVVSHNEEWEDKHGEDIRQLVELLPHGSGIDGSTTLDYDKSNGNRIIILSEFHTMDKHGFYGKWISYKVTVTPSLTCGIDLTIVGDFGKCADIKDYLYETYYWGFRQPVEWDTEKAGYHIVSDAIAA